MQKHTAFFYVWILKYMFLDFEPIKTGIDTDGIGIGTH